MSRAVGLLAMVGVVFFAGLCAIVAAQDAAQPASQPAIDAAAVKKAQAAKAAAEKAATDAQQKAVAAEKARKQAEAAKADALKAMGEAKDQVAKAEAARKQAEAEKAQALADKAKAEAEKAQALADKAKAEAAGAQALTDKEAADAARTEAEKKLKDKEEAEAAEKKAKQELAARMAAMDVSKLDYVKFQSGDKLHLMSFSRRKVYLGDIANFKSPCTIKLRHVFGRIKYYASARATRKGSAQYWIYMTKANKVFKGACRKFARSSECDLICEDRTLVIKVEREGVTVGKYRVPDRTKEFLEILKEVGAD